MTRRELLAALLALPVAPAALCASATGGFVTVEPVLVGANTYSDVVPIAYAGNTGVPFNLKWYGGFDVAD